MHTYLCIHRPEHPAASFPLTTFFSPSAADDATIAAAVAALEPAPIIRIRPARLDYPELPTDPTVALETVRGHYEGCARCHLCESRTFIVHTRGNLYSPVVAIGEGPGTDEDKRGLPFVGRSGRLQDELFREAGLDPERDLAWMNLVGCFTGDTPVIAPRVERSFRRYYRGDLVEIQTRGSATGADAGRRRKLTGTPNHPVLTARGWVPLGALVEGDDLICGTLRQGVGARDPHMEHGSARFDDLLRTLSLVGVGERVVGAHGDFHGDGGEAEIEVVTDERLLLDRREPARSQELEELSLVAAPLGAGALHPKTHGFATTAELDAPDLEPPFEVGVRDPKIVRERLRTLASEVTTDRIVFVKRRRGDTHVYNLQTSEGWYTADGIIVSNCRPCLTRCDPDRAPTLVEKLACSERTLMLLRALRPRVVLLLGQVACSAFFDEPPPVNRWIGPLQDPRAPLDWVLFLHLPHPAGLLRSIGAAHSYSRYKAGQLLFRSIKAQLPTWQKVARWPFGLRYLANVQPVAGKPENRA